MRYPALLTLTAVLLAAACGDDAPPPGDDAAPNAAPAPAAADASEPDSVSATPADTMTTEEPQAASGAETPPETTGADDGLFTAQVAAFLGEAAGRRLAQRLESAGLPVWTTEARVDGRGFLRVRVGATPSYQDAVRLGEMIAREHDLEVWVAPVTPGSQLPADAVEATRSLLDGE